MTRIELENAITTLGRPLPSFQRDTTRDGFHSAVGAIHAVQRSLRAMREWDAANPEKAAEHVRLTAELEQMQRHEQALARSQHLAARALDVLERSGVGERSLAAAANPEPRPALLAAQKWFTEQPTPWILVLRGSPGLGKTVAAAWALRRAALQGEVVAARSAREIATLGGFNEGAVELRMLMRCGLLVVNDLGREPLNEWGQATLFDLIDARYEASARTIVTSNRTWDEMRTRLGEAVVDRIRHGGRVVELAGESLRGGQQRRNA